MEEARSPAVFRFAGFTLDLNRTVLLDPLGREVALRPKSFDLLRYLSGNAGRLVSREELLGAVWPSVFVGDDNVTQCIAEVRRALGDAGGRLLRTIPKRGYLFEAEGADAATAQAGGAREGKVASTTENSEPGTRSPLRGNEHDALLSAPLDLPSLVVLPLVNLSGDPEQEYFADGMTDELTTALTRVRWFFVIARNSAFTYRGKAVDVRQVGHELGVRYAVEGSVRKAGGLVRISVQMAETETGHQVWADRFDGSLENIFELQDRVAEAVTGVIEPNLWAAEVVRASAKPTGNLDAYDLYLRALPQLYSHTRTGNDAAIALLRQAIALDPCFALAKAFASFAHTFRKSQGWTTPEETIEGALLAKQALTAAPDDPSVLRLAGIATVNLGGNFDAGIAAAERALAINPNSAQVLSGAGWIYNYACEPAKAIPLFERAIRLSPLDPEVAHMFSGIGISHLIGGNLQAALHWGERSVRHTPTWLSGHRVLISAFMQLGREREAREAAASLAGLVPHSLERPHPFWRYRSHDFVMRHVEALRAAGLAG